LLQHYLRRSITMDQALGVSGQPDELQQMIQRAQPGQSPYAASGLTARR
jgi:hypothetical protein